MKKIALALIILLFVNISFAQTPQYIPYQAVARNASGNLLINQNVSLRFTIRETSASGTIDYQETQSATTNNLGLFSVNIGNGAVLTGTFSTIPWGNGVAKFTQVEIDPSGGNSYIDMGASRMMSVPFALYAGNATSVTSTNLTESTSDVLSITGGNNSVVSASGTTIQVKKASGSQDGYLSASDWVTFNNKQGALTFNQPLSNSSNTVSIGYDNSTIKINGSNQLFDASPASGVTATNGLTATTGNAPVISLGGTLTGNTAITQSTFNLIDNLTSTGDFNIEKNGSAALYVLGNHGAATDGYVGVGISSPIAPLVVNNSSTTTLSNGAFDVFQPSLATGNNVYLKLGVGESLHNEADLSFYYAGAGSTANYLGIGFFDLGAFAVFTASSTVGIGTTSPSATLHVVGTGIYTGELYVNALGTGTGTGATGSVQIGDGTIAKANGNSFWMNSGLSLGSYSGTNSPTNGLIVPGQVGIGTTGPAYKLQVVNTSNTDGMLLQNSNGGGGAQTNIYFETYNGEPTPAGAISAIDDGSFSAHLTFSTRVPGSASNALTERMRIESNGAVGIGTNNPTQALLVVNGTQNNTLSYGWLNSSGNTGAATATAAYSIYGNGRIAGLEFNAFSDARIKRIVGRTDNADDLNTLMNLQITNYHFIDTIEKGNKLYKKVIAQEVEKVYPDAISKMTSVVPDIYQVGQLKNGRVTLANNLKVGDRVRIITSDKSDLYNVTAADNTGFSVKLDGEGKVFVYGREVNDFRSVDYEALSTLNISATQELAKRLADTRSKNEELEKEISILKNANNDLTKKVDGLSSSTGDIQLLYKELDELKSLMQKNGITTEK